MYLCDELRLPPTISHTHLRIHNRYQQWKNYQKPQVTRKYLLKNRLCYICITIDVQSLDNTYLN